MASKGGPALVKGEVEGVIDFVIKRAKTLQKRTIEVNIEEITPLMIGATDKNHILNRIRWKMPTLLRAQGIIPQLMGQESPVRYRFTIENNIDITPEGSSEKDFQPLKGREPVKTHTNWRTPFIAPHYFGTIFRQVQKGRIPLLKGDKGCGKSRVAEEIMARLGLTCIRIAMGEVRDPVDLVGTKEVVNENGVPVTKFVGGLITEAAQKGWGVVLDEIDSITANVGLVFNKMFEENATMVLLTETGIETLQPHPDFRVIATANTWGRGDSSGFYAGTQMQNDATMDRFRPKQDVEYDLKIERQLVSQYLPPAVVEALYCESNNLGKEGLIVLIRRAIADSNNEIDDICGMRAILYFAQEYQDLGWHRGMYYFVREFREEYHNAIIKIITDRFGISFVPSINDYDESKPDYITNIMNEVIAAGF
jgi:hypothetical protein